jgi:hypothetical protein
MRPNIIKCPHCSTDLDISNLGAVSQVQCVRCDGLIDLGVAEPSPPVIRQTSSPRRTKPRPSFRNPFGPIPLAIVGFLVLAGIRACNSQSADKANAPSTRTSISEPQSNPDGADVRQLQQLLFQQAIQREQAARQRQSQEFQQSLERAATCSYCGGSGSYRFVDGNGDLQMKLCPRCRGMGSRY